MYTTGLMIKCEVIMAIKILTLLVTGLQNVSLVEA